MAKADQIIELLKSHIKGDNNRFYSIAMQVAAHEARQGHEKLASELKGLIDQAKEKQSVLSAQSSVVSLLQPKGELSQLLSAEYVDTRFAELTFSPEVSMRFERIISEQRQHSTLSKHGLQPRRKILLFGPPGTGKTVTASALAGELHLPLFTVRLDGLITKYMGETSSKLRLIFDAMRNTRAIYLFDEFDAIGGDRSLSNDVGEVRRILNSFLQFMEQDRSDSIIIAATNYVKLLDDALFRRFDDVVVYSLPDQEQIKKIITNRLSIYNFTIKSPNWKNINKIAEELSHAEITKACDEAVKHSILSGSKVVLGKELICSLQERKQSSAYTLK